MKRRRLIALTGPARSGKDTVAQFLAADHGFHIVSFAEPLYAAVSAITGYSVAHLQNRDNKEQPIRWLSDDASPRKLLQTLGTEWGRDLIDENIWVRIAMRKADRLFFEGKDVVITDVRTPQELPAIRKREGLLVNVVRPGVCHGSVRDHPTENPAVWAEADCFFHNCGDNLSDLRRRVGVLLPLVDGANAAPSTAEMQ